MALPRFGGAIRENTGGKLFPLGAKTPAAFLFTQPLCLGDETMKWIHLAILAGLFVCPAALVTSYMHEFVKVDSALDAGASYDYVAGRADFS